LEVDIRHCANIGILSLVLKYAVDKNCFFAFDACKAKRRSYLTIYRSDESRTFNRSSDQQIQPVMNHAA